MKKLFTLIAFLAVFMGAKAETMVDAFVDFSTVTEIPRFSWGGSESAFARLSLQNGCLHFESTEATDPSWDCQFFPIGGVDAEVGVTYTLHYKIKGDHNGNVSMLGFGLTPYGQFAITTDWVEGTVDYVCEKADGNILMQCGDWIGTWDIAYLKITHEGKPERPAEWKELLVNGDAEKSWEDLGLADVAFDDMDNNTKVCFWTKEKGVNDHNPHPAEIITENNGNHAFICRATTADTEGNESAWDNQIWFQSPRTWKAGETFKLSFRYKASEPVLTNTQVHHQKPSDYLHYIGIGDVNFTTEWQTFEKEITVSAEQAGMWSVAFNLNPNVKTPVDFYIDDLSWGEMVLEHGLFIAAANTESGLVDYDFDAAEEFTYNDDQNYYEATVGTAGNQDSWVNEVMISTVRGNARQFKANTIKVKGALADDPEAWRNIEEGANAVIKLPSQGVWNVYVDLDASVMNVEWIEGDTPRNPIDIKPNPTEIVIEGQERDWRGLNEDGSQIEEGGVGEGQPWDNQFWIFANRPLKANEKMVIEFDYVATREAKTTTQLHGLTDSFGPQYLYWQAIGDVTFTTEEKHFKSEFTYPADGAKTVVTINGEDVAITAHGIAFNMAEIKEACNYTIKNVVWKLEDETESLIDMEGEDNFWVKIGAGTNPYPTDIKNVTNNNSKSTVIYNIAGQRVSNNYKGLVIKNGSKYIVK